VDQVRRESQECRPQLGEFVREQRRLGSMSLRKLSELSGVSNPYLSQIERGLRRPSAEVLQQLAGALQVPAEWLYVRAGILAEGGRPDERGAVGVVEAIRRDAALTEDQKRALLHVYEAFRVTATPVVAVAVGPPSGLAVASSGGESRGGDSG
jgi:transcriptional regulator with XRE-family HTH domain